MTGNSGKQTFGNRKKYDSARAGDTRPGVWLTS